MNQGVDNSVRCVTATIAERCLMFGKLAVATTIFFVFLADTAHAQEVAWPSVILSGNHPAEAVSRYPVAHADPAAQLHMQVTLGLRNQTQLDQLLRDQQNPASPRYHQWLSPEQFTARFGPAQSELDAVVQWLSAQGLMVTGSSLAQRYVRFSGSVADAERAFVTNIMLFGGAGGYSNITDPAIPARFSGVISAISGLDNFRHSMAFANSPILAQRAAAPEWTASPLALLDSGPVLPASSRSAIAPAPDVAIGGETAFGPQDFYSFYDESSLLSGGTNGGHGDCIAIVGDSDYTHSAVTLFNTRFGLPSSSITTVLVGGVNPGINDDEVEALLDLEWSHAVAPGAPTRFYLGSGAPAIVGGIQAAVNDNKCGTISVSFGLCGFPAAFYTGTLSPIYAQAAAQGQSIFVASGDQGAAGIILDPSATMCVTGTSRNVNELGTDANVTEVGGTLFTPNYDGSGNNVGHVAESVWNDSLAHLGGGSTGGGASAFYFKPAYQKGPGVPNDGKRDVPDIALIGSPYSPGVFWGGVSGGSPVIDCCLGGTSLSAPAWAGIAKLVAQLLHGRPGPLNPRIYTMANAGQGISGFRDVLTGNNDFNGVVGFNAGPGFDLTTGWGTVDIATFAKAYAAIPSAPAITTIPSAIEVGSSFTITGTNFSPGAVVNFFVATSVGPMNEGPLTPSSNSPTSLTVPVPSTIPLGQGFVEVQVVNADAGFKASNTAGALLQGSAAGIPTLKSVNGTNLAATSSNPNYATNNVQTVLFQGTTVTLGGSGFDAAHGVAVNVFCACAGGKAGPIFVTPGSGGLNSTSFSFTMPPSVPDGPASIVVVNRGADGSYSKSSNAVSVPVSALITVKSVSQSGNTITVKGTGFSTLTVINFFNQRGGPTVNLGGLGVGGLPKIRLTLISSSEFTFTKPLDAMPGKSYVQALNPPFVPYTSSDGPGGAFTLL